MSLALDRIEQRTYPRADLDWIRARPARQSPAPEPSSHHLHWGARTVIAAQDSTARRTLGEVMPSTAVIALLGAAVAVALAGVADDAPVLAPALGAPVPETAEAYAPPPLAQLDALPPRQQAAVPPVSPPRALKPAPPRLRVSHSAPPATTAHRAREFFLLGNDHARRGRWQAAQAAYARALALAPHADFAFNLAVSLEHLGRTGEALVHYRAAVAMADEQSRFDKHAVAARVTALAHAGSNAP